MKKRILVTATLLCVAFLMATMAYNIATVTNTASLKVVNTSEALLTLEDHTPWSWQKTTGAKDKTAAQENGELVFRFGRGVGRDGTSPVFYGLQPNSCYQWNPLFTLRNKSAETINVTLSVEGPFKEYVTFGTCGQDSPPTWGTKGNSFTINNVPKEVNSGMQNIRNIAVKLDIPSGATVSPNEIMGKIIVEAVAVN